jgi:hypothetical protein
MEKPYCTHLLSSEYNHFIYSKVPTLGIAIILPELCLLIQQYFDTVDYTSLLYDQPFE